MGNHSPNPERLANLPAGYDEEDPYEGEDIETYPQWWQENVKEFKEHNMRPYRPPQFKDGTIVPELARELQEQLGVDIRFQNKNPQSEASVTPHQKHEWHVLVDGEPISKVQRYRSPEGYSVYGLESSAFEKMIRDNLN